jgi:hypothetical protein
MQQQQQLWQADYLAQHQQQPVLQQQDHHLQQQHCADADEASVVIDFLQRYASCGWKGSAGGAREAVSAAELDDSAQTAAGVGLASCRPVSSSSSSRYELL